MGMPVASEGKTQAIMKNARVKVYAEHRDSWVKSENAECIHTLFQEFEGLDRF